MYSIEYIYAGICAEHDDWALNSYTHAQDRIVNQTSYTHGLAASLNYRVLSRPRRYVNVESGVRG